MLDQQERATVGLLYRNHLIGILGYNLPNCNSPEELIALARSMTPPPYEAEQGWHCEPPFPGAYDTPTEMLPHFRMVTACALLDANNEVLGYFWLTLVSGKPAVVVLSGAGPGNEVPSHYIPLK